MNDSPARGVGLVSFYCYHRNRASAVWRLHPVLWALVDFQLTPLTRNNLPVAVGPATLVKLWRTMWLEKCTHQFWWRRFKSKSFFVFVFYRALRVFKESDRYEQNNNDRILVLCLLYVQSMISTLCIVCSKYDQWKQWKNPCTLSTVFSKYDQLKEW